MTPGQIRSGFRERITSMESTAGRLLSLLSLLQARPHWNAAELADRLGITDQTVRRDVNRLRELGYPVVAEAGRAGGYQLGAGGGPPPLAAAAGLATRGRVLPARPRDRVLALNTATVLVRSGDGPAVDPEVLLLLAQGCRRPERVRFGYRDGSGNVTSRRVEPYRLVNTDRRWYFVAHDLDRVDWRTFRVDRMSEPALTGHRFVRTAEPDAARMVVDGLALGSYQWQAEVLLDAELPEAAAEIPRTIGSVESADGATLLRMGANDLEWIARYIAGLPFDAQVRKPPELRAALRALGRRLQRAHG